jgi:Uma2 family endonuclease
MSTASRFVPNYTVTDYRHWEGDWQLIEGVAVAMTPSPFGPHERIVAELIKSFGTQLDRQHCDCRVYAGLDWIVSENTVVRPDVMVVCGEQPERHLETPPEVAVEILSASTRELDLVVKRRIYREHRVPVYMIVDPDSRRIEITRLGSDASHKLEIGQTGELSLSNGCTIAVDVSQVFR